MATSLNVKTHGLLPFELALSPSTIVHQSFNPDLTHTVAIVSGYDGYHEHIAQVDATGALKVNSGATSYLNYKVYNVTVDSTTPSSATISFPDYVNEIDLMISDNSVNLSMMSSTTNQWQDPIELPVSNVELKYVTKAIQLWCAVSGSTSTVQVVVWW